jgi:hypothetical protein
MPYHIYVLLSRRDKIYYINGLDLDFKLGTEPGFIHQELTHNLAELIELSSEYSVLADKRPELKDIDKALNGIVSRIIVHQGGAVVDGNRIWQNTYPVPVIETGWLCFESFRDHFEVFRRAVTNPFVPFNDLDI